MTSSPPPVGWNAVPAQPYGGAATGAPYPPTPIGSFGAPVGRVPAVAWLIPLAAVLAIVGACTPWFHSSLVLDGSSHQLTHALYSWRDGKIGLVAPIGLAAASIGVVSLLLGRSSRFRRFGSDPVVGAARAAMFIGGISLVCAIIAWFLVPSNYYFDTEQGRLTTSKLLSEAHANGHSASLTHGPQVGYFLTVVAGALAVVAGVLMLLMRDRTAQMSTFGTPGFGASTPAFPGQPLGAPVPPAGGFRAPAASYAAPASQAPPPPVPGWNPPSAAPSGDNWSVPTGYPSSAGGSDADPDGRVDLSK